MFTIKSMKNGLGEWGVYYGNNGKAIKLAYKRFFKSKEIADKWANKFKDKLFKIN